MCLAAAILPWVVDLLNSLGYTITIRTSSTDQEEEEAAARACHLRGATSAFATAAPPGAASVVVTSSSSSSSSAAAAEGGRRRGAPRIGMTAASLQMTTIGPSHCQSSSAASDKENDSRQSNNQKKASASDGGESKATSTTTGATASDGATSVTGANMVALSTTTTTTAVVSPVVDSIGPSPASPSDSNGGGGGGGGGGGVARSSSRTCCFCWCCCCSCSCITVQNGEQSSSGPPIMKKKEDSDVPHKVDDLPTQDELKAWGESFDKLMQSTRGREKFREFLRSEYSEENVLFWLACEELKKQTNPESIEERARSIYEDYISILSPKEVSLDSRAREVINKNMVHPSPHTFDDAQFQIYTLMHRDSYPRFLNSNIYKRLLIVQ